MIVAIHQPNFIPWLGYFYKIYKSDVFVFLDNVQFTKNSFQNRTRVKASQGPIWLTEPVLTKGRFGQLTNEVEFNNSIPWRKKHLRTLEVNYKKSSHFDNFFSKLQEIYFKKEWKMLVEFNIELTKFVCSELGFKKRFEIASKLGVTGKATELLINICKKLGADVYLSGSGGRKYQREELFRKAGIKVIYSDFKHPIYPQLWGSFEPNLSIIDLLLNCGEQSIDILTGKRIS